MYFKNPSNRTFSNQDLSNWQSQKCEFCMYKSIIMEQLQRLKEAVIIKNKRINDLEHFIKKISDMAFTNPLSLSPSLQMEINQGALLENYSSNAYSESLEGFNINKQMSKFYKQKKFEDPRQISFRDDRLNPLKFQLKVNQNSFEQKNVRIQRITELNEIKKQLQRKFHATSNKENQRIVKQVYSDRFGRQQEEQTFRTLSQPQQQGRVGSFQQIEDENSISYEASSKRSRLNDSTFIQPVQLRKCTSIKQALIKSEDKNQITIIKEYLKKLK